MFPVLTVLFPDLAKVVAQVELQVVLYTSLFAVL